MNKFFKLFSISLMLALIGCDGSVTTNEFKAAEVLCKANSGVSVIITEPIIHEKYDDVVCNNGAIFHGGDSTARIYDEMFGNTPNKY